jgi:acetylornithine deacetylase
MDAKGDREARILRMVDQQRAEGLDLLDELLRAARHGEAAMQAVVAREFRTMGYDTDVFEADLSALRIHPEFSLLPELAALDTGGRPNMVAQLPGVGRGQSLFTFAHIDSYALDAEPWSVDPYRVSLGSDGRAYGYGIADDRSGVVGMIMAARAIAAAGLRPAGSLVMASCLGKHLGVGGTLAVVARGYRGDGAVYLHPAETGAGLTEFKAVSLGVVQFRVMVPGQSPRFREQNQTPAAHWGINAIQRAAQIMTDLLAWDRERGKRVHHPLVHAALGRSTNLNITRIEGGGSDNQFPEECSFTGVITFPPGESVAEVRAAFEAAVHEAAASVPHGTEQSPTVAWQPMMASPGETNPEDPFLRCFVACIEETTGRSPSIWPAHTASDIRYPLVYAASPTIGFGPRAGNIGGPDEWLDVDDFTRAVKSLALLIARWCGLVPLTPSEEGADQ